MASETTPPSRSSAGRGLSLRTKWTVSVLAVAVVPMLVLGAVVLRLQRDGLARVERELEAAIVDEASSQVASTLRAASDLAVRTGAILADESDDVDERLSRIREEAARAPVVRSVAFFDEQRRFVDAVVVRDERDDMLRSPPRGEGFRRIRGEAGTVARFEHRVGGERGEEERGFVVVTLSPSVLGDRLRELSTSRFGVPDRLYVLDDDGEVFAGEPPKGGGRAPVLSALPPEGAAFGMALVLTAEFVDHGTAKVGTIRTLPDARVAVVVERPADEAFATLAETRRALFGGLALFTAIAAFVGAWLARRALSPVNALMLLVRRYGRRELAARSDVRTRDELQALGESLERMADELSASEAEIARRARIEAELARYLPSEVAKSVTGESRLALSGARRPLTVVFADVVAFTGFAEQTSPERAVAFLNELFTILSEIVFRHGGMIDKFIGDCVMAIFDDHEHDDGRGHAARALAAAEDMHRFVEASQPRWTEEYGFEVRLGIGVATGEALLGNLGSDARMEYTAIGDTVNVAARLESLARPRQTLTTHAVAAACPSFEFASLGEHAIRGRSAPIEVFEVLS